MLFSENLVQHTLLNVPRVEDGSWQDLNQVWSPKSNALPLRYIPALGWPTRGHGMFKDDRKCDQNKDTWDLRLNQDEQEIQTINLESINPFLPYSDMKNIESIEFQ